MLEFVIDGCLHLFQFIGLFVGVLLVVLFILTNLILDSGHCCADLDGVLFMFTLDVLARHLKVAHGALQLLNHFSQLLYSLFGLIVVLDGIIEVHPLGFVAHRALQLTECSESAVVIYHGSLQGFKLHLLGLVIKSQIAVGQLSLDVGNGIALNSYFHELSLLIHKPGHAVPFERINFFCCWVLLVWVIGHFFLGNFKKVSDVLLSC